jgi:hypothetical protein
MLGLDDDEMITACSLISHTINVFAQVIRVSRISAIARNPGIRNSWIRTG